MNRVLAHGDFQEGIRWLVLEGPIGTPCAYVGIPESSPAAGLNTDFLDATGPSPHGGWTYAGTGDDIDRPAGWFWWGWDYSHAWDWTPYTQTGHWWTVDEVVADVHRLLPDFEAWLRSRPEEGAPADARKPPPTIDELTAMADELFGEEWRDGR